MFQRILEDQVNLSGVVGLDGSVAQRRVSERGHSRRGQDPRQSDQAQTEFSAVHVDVSIWWLELGILWRPEGSQTSAQPTEVITGEKRPSNSNRQQSLDLTGSFIARNLWNQAHPNKWPASR